MSIERDPGTGPESVADWEALDCCIEGLLLDDASSLRYGANRIADMTSPFASEFELCVRDYEETYGDIELLQRSIETILRSGTAVVGTDTHRKLLAVQEEESIIVDNIMRSGLRTFVYADMETYRGLNPSVYKNIFYLAATTAGQRLEDADDWIMRALYPTDELLRDIEQLEGATLSPEDAALDTYRGLKVLSELGLASPHMRKKLKSLEKLLYYQT